MPQESVAKGYCGSRHCLEACEADGLPLLACEPGGVLLLGEECSRWRRYFVGLGKFEFRLAGFEILRYLLHGDPLASEGLRDDAGSVGASKRVKDYVVFVGERITPHVIEIHQSAPKNPDEYWTDDLNTIINWTRGNQTPKRFYS